MHQCPMFTADLARPLARPGAHAARAAHLWGGWALLLLMCLAGCGAGDGGQAQVVRCEEVEVGGGCGACATGRWSCEPSGQARCVGEDPLAAPNACGGCQVLRAVPGQPCGDCAEAAWTCTPQGDLRCPALPADTRNACGGCTELADTPGQACGTCEEGRWRCQGSDALVCEGDRGPRALNPCGTCGEPQLNICGLCGEDGINPCGTCGEPQLNACGKCGQEGLNACGGCEELLQAPNAPCGSCAQARYACQGQNALICIGQALCRDGLACQSDADCAPGQCSNGHCAPAGFAYIAPGTFTMGAPTSERGFHPERENGQHTVTLTRPFLMARTTVTQGQWRAQMGTSPAYFGQCGEDCPVERVSWWEAVQYANALSQAEGLPSCYRLEACQGSLGGAGCRPSDPNGGQNCASGYCDLAALGGLDLDCKGYRLPTEAEWEYAARATTTTPFLTASGQLNHWSYTPLDPAMDAIAWYGANSLVSYAGGLDCSASFPGAQPATLFCGPHPVGQKLPNLWGLHDVTGNVWEWVWDWADTYPAPGSLVVDPTGPAQGTSRRMRGGAFLNVGPYLRVAYRTGPQPVGRWNNIGFRLARSLPPQTVAP